MNQPWTEPQAEDGKLGGGATILGPSRQQWDATHLEAEAIGREAVRLAATGDSVYFTTTAQSNSIDVRFSIPDSAGGGGMWTGGAPTALFHKTGTNPGW